MPNFTKTDISNEKSTQDLKYLVSFEFNDLIFALLESTGSSEQMPRICNYCNTIIPPTDDAFILVADQHLHDEELIVCSERYLICSKCQSDDIAIEQFMALMDVKITSGEKND